MKALITGATSGLGKAMAEILSKKGWELILTGRNSEALKELQKSLKTNVYTVTCDLSKPQNAYKLYKVCRKHSIDLLINNAGFGVFGYFGETSLKSELDMINVNITSLHILTKLFLRDFLRHNRGRIINIASGAGFMTGPKLSGYYASKNYVVRLSLAIAEELKHLKTNVKISVFCPGPIDTKFNERAGVSFSIKPKSAEYMAEYALEKAFSNKTVIIPTFTMKIGVALSKIFPEKIVAPVVFHIQNKKSVRK
ncbi:MAG: SDR family oxidoreductase [Oscillospiraceae bacterium]|nr:SDR family oxidoreductase [Oscillospiraceae bacterium]